MYIQKPSIRTDYSSNQDRKNNHMRAPKSKLFVTLGILLCFLGGYYFFEVLQKHESKSAGAAYALGKKEIVHAVSEKQTIELTIPEKKKVPI